MKRLSMGEMSHCNEQFENIAKLKKKYKENGNPVISCDTKKKKLIGELFKPGVVYGKVEIAAFDHDFPHLAKGKAIPYGICNVNKNSAYICIGTSHDTSEFMCDSIKKWWIEIGHYDYPSVTSILILMDGEGGAIPAVTTFLRRPCKT